MVRKLRVSAWGQSTAPLRKSRRLQQVWLTCSAFNLRTSHRQQGLPQLPSHSNSVLYFSTRSTVF
uniref:Uncharacterized protein n=1 Tax=Anguilla anguilla TaxID=7936 RepID=A0A0E9V790_ANGAN